MDTTRSICWLRGSGVVTALALAGGTLVACGDDSNQTGTGTQEGTPTTETPPLDDDPSGAATPSDPEPPVIDPGDDGDYAVDLDPADFVEVIDNPYLPLVSGNRWVYEGIGEDSGARVEVEVTDEERQVMGIPVVVVQDTEYEDGEIVEDTKDWFAQDRDGNVWYLGEDTAEYEDGEILNTEGAWEAGVDGALPGIVMPADPTVGDAYRQEYYAGEAEDMGEVLEVGVSRSIEQGDYDDVLLTQDWTPLEPEVVENKYYAPGIGLIQAVKAAGGSGGEELVEFLPAD